MIVREARLLEGDIMRLTASCIKEHRAGLGRLNRLDEYYKGNHEILSRVMVGEGSPNNRLVCNHAKYITDTAIGFAFGEPVQYSGEGCDELIGVWRSGGIEGHDAELAKDLSVFGRAYELVYVDRDRGIMPRIALIDPRCGFVVYDDTVLARPILAVHYYQRTDVDGRPVGYCINVYTDREHFSFEADNIDGQQYTMVSSETHFFGRVPMAEYRNNEEAMGDFEGVISLIDAYNKLASDRVNDKERFVNAILFVQGFTFDKDTVEILKEHGILEAPADHADAKYLIKTLDETQTEILRLAIEQDIHKLSMVPCMSDRSFAGNSSGVALKYKLMGLEHLTKIKERFFALGVMHRIEIYKNIFNVLGKPDVGEMRVKLRAKVETEDVYE